MASCFIVSRSTKSGRKHVVRYRLGGRAYPIQHGGAFPTQKEAKVRRDLIAGELAAGRNPAELLATITTPPTVRTFSDVFDSFVASRVDVSEATLDNYGTHRARLVKQLGTKAPEAIRWQEVQDAIGSLAEELAASSLRGYLGTLRLVLDYADVDPNPARDRRVKLPRVESEIPTPPTASEVAAIIANAPKKWRLAIRVLEQTGMRVGELAGIEWGDVDHANLRLRVRSGKTKSARRFVAVPEWLMEEIEATCPPDDRTGARRVFPGASRQTVGNAIRNGCRAAGLVGYSPHDLRHRYISVKIREGVPVTEIAAQVGHARTSLTLDTYAHVLVEEGRPS
jgi:integrase